MKDLNNCISHDLRDLKYYLEEKIAINNADLELLENNEAIKNELKILKSFVASLNKAQETLNDMAYIINDSISELQKVNNIVDGYDL